MSATIILIMTSSSTRNTEPPGGRVAVMMISSPVPSIDGSQITLLGAMSTCADTSPRAVAGFGEGLIARQLNAKVSAGVPRREQRFSEETVPYKISSPYASTCPGRTGRSSRQARERDWHGHDPKAAGKDDVSAQPAAARDQQSGGAARHGRD